MGRLVTVALPLAAVALIRAAPRVQISSDPMVLQVVLIAAAVVAAFALLVAVAATFEDGRLRDLADLTALGIVSATFIVVALDVAGEVGLAIGLAGAAALALAGSAVLRRSLGTRRDRVGGLFIAIVLVDTGLAGVLLAGNAAVSAGPMVLAAGAALMAVAALASLDDPTRATALGIAASSVAALAIGGPLGNETLVGTAGIGLAAGVLGARLVFGRAPRVPAAERFPALPELPFGGATPPGEPEFDELSRITRELRATLDDLVAARHLIELQRVEIDRAVSVDQLTGLASRWPTLDRLRTEAAEARRYAHPVAVVLFDIDGFAALNHEHGLETGDAILREVALRLRMRMREADALGRTGADAFLAVLPHTDEGGAAAFATAVLDRLLERKIVTAHGEIAVGLSIGIALMRSGTTLTGEELLAAAEEALASARAAGGNRIAFDRLHGLARLDGDQTSETEPSGPAAEAQPS
ncbi:MAG TPA: GGDEF domain-containing protein [Methylomirabilota bacterium]|nr:GGDEF domain-containing protein [Methylomirabilota bacterium]